MDRKHPLESTQETNDESAAFVMQRKTIIGLRQDVAQLKKKETDLTKKTAEQYIELETLRANCAAMQTQVVQLNEEKSQLKAKLVALEFEKLQKFNPAMGEVLKATEEISDVLAEAVKKNELFSHALAEEERKNRLLIKAFENIGISPDEILSNMQPDVIVANEEDDDLTAALNLSMGIDVPKKPTVHDIPEEVKRFAEVSNVLDEAALLCDEIEFGNTLEDELSASINAMLSGKPCETLAPKVEIAVSKAVDPTPIVRRYIFNKHENEIGVVLRAVEELVDPKALVILTDAPHEVQIEIMEHVVDVGRQIIPQFVMDKWHEYNRKECIQEDATFLKYCQLS